MNILLKNACLNKLLVNCCSKMTKTTTSTTSPSSSPTNTLTINNGDRNAINTNLNNNCKKKGKYSMISKIILYVWFKLTISFAILNTIIFISPHWYGNVDLPYLPIELSGADTIHLTEYRSSSNELASKHVAHFGLFRYCFKLSLFTSSIKNEDLNENSFNLTSYDIMGRNESNFSIIQIKSNKMELSTFQTFFKCTGHWSQTKKYLNNYFKSK